MSLNEAAVHAISSLSETVEVGKEMLASTGGRITVVHDQHTTTDLEKFLPSRTRYRGHVTTDSIDSFAAYSRSQNGGTVFIAEESMTAKAIFNLGTQVEPGHCDNSAQISLNKTAAFEALLANDGKRLSQKQLCLFLEDWANSIKVYKKSTEVEGEPEEVRLVEALAAIRNLTIENMNKAQSVEGNSSRAMSAMERIDISTGDIEIDHFIFTTQTYKSLSERSFKLQFTTLNDDGVALSYRIMQLEELKEAIANEFKEKLEGAFKKSDAMTFLLGSFDPLK